MHCAEVSQFVLEQAYTGMSERTMGSGVGRGEVAQPARRSKMDMNPENQIPEAIIFSMLTVFPFLY